MPAVEGSQARGQYMRVPDTATRRLHCWYLNAAERIPHSVTFDPAPDSVKLTPAGHAKRFHIHDPCSIQPPFDTLPDSRDVTQLEAVELLWDFFKVHRGQSVWLFQLTR